MLTIPAALGNGTTTWFASYGRRTAIEAGNSKLRTHRGMNFRGDWCRSSTPTRPRRVWHACTSIRQVVDAALLQLPELRVYLVHRPLARAAS